VSGFASLVNAVFVGRTDDEQAQAEALRLLRVPTGSGYEQMLGTLSPRPRHDDRPDDTPGSSCSPTGTAASRRSGSTSRPAPGPRARGARHNPDATGSPSVGAPAAALRARRAGPARAGPPTRRRSPAAPSARATVPLTPHAAADAELLDDETSTCSTTSTTCPSRAATARQRGPAADGDRFPGGAVR
jgi:hypothetical protein